MRFRNVANQIVAEMPGSRGQSCSLIPSGQAMSMDEQEHGKEKASQGEILEEVE